MAKAKISPGEWYTLTNLAQEKMFPWCGTDLRRYRGIVKADAAKENILKAVTIGTGFATRYQIKGENIIKFIKRFEEGKVQL